MAGSYFLALAPRFAFAQAKVPRIGYLLTVPLAEKPSPEFFARVVAEAECAPAAVAYVGDRLDNDVLPAVEAGMTGGFLKRGPWGWLHAGSPEAARATLRIDALSELSGALRGLP